MTILLIVSLTAMCDSAIKQPSPLPHHHHEDEHILVSRMPDSNTVRSVAEAMKQLGDPSRLRIFWLLCHCEECVINIAAATGMSSPAVSHHLQLLKKAGLIVSRRSGKEKYYRAADTALADKLHHTIEEISMISCPEHQT